MATHNMGSDIFVFGKHKGESFDDVYRNDPSYVAWAMRIENPTGQMLGFCNFVRSMEQQQTYGNQNCSFKRDEPCNQPNKGVAPRDLNWNNSEGDARKPYSGSNNGASPADEAPVSVSGVPSKCYTKALDGCLEAKWRRLTAKLHSAEEEEELRWRQRKIPMPHDDPSDMIVDDSMTLRRVLESVSETKKRQLPQSSKVPQQKAVNASRDTAERNAQSSQGDITLESLIYGSKLPKVGPYDSNLDTRGSSQQLTLKDNLSQTKITTTNLMDATSVMRQSNVVTSANNSTASTAAPMRSGQQTLESTMTGATSISMAPEKSPDDFKLNIEGVVALVLHSETEFYVTFNKPLRDNVAVWSSVIPHDLFEFLRAVEPGLVIKKDDKYSHVVFAADKYDVVLRALRKGLANCQCPVDPIPNFILRTFPAFTKYSKERSLPEKTKDALSGVVCEYTQENKTRLADIIGHELYSQLKPFQREGVEFGIRKNGRVLIGDEMGLGKTLQALAISAFYCVDWPLLIVCPSSLRFQWRDQCIRWLPHLLEEDEICTVKSGKTEIPDNTKVVIISYDLYALNEHFRHAFRIVICDESHYLKNSKAKRTKCLVPLLKSTQRTILLSGTPTLNSPSELFEQIACLLPSFCSDTTFIERYCEKKLHWYTKRMVYSGSKHADELHLFLVRTVMIRRLKENVLHELPPKIRSKVPIELPKTFLRECERHIGFMPTENQLNEDGDKTKTRELFQLTGQAKTKGVCEYIIHLMKSEIKFIIFAHHKSVMDAIEKTLHDQKCNYIRIDGTTTQNKREEYVNRFQNQADCTVALLSLTSCGVGLNLTASSTVVFAELYWVPGQIIQAEDRAHRIGTKHRTINVHYLIAENSIEETMWKVINRKWKGVTATLNGETSNLILVKEAEKERLNEMAKQLKIDELVE
ncbi:helicase conserved C-terminal domain containing protein [Babesia divergens]|uniref:Helicase conserved C-terminal domain containing protein n=1 Tax=Babesia divergens TaxID=32595 RepID=A0AAD9LDP2_BABDI|nr:helicase conserved C-terminal domain containing protein [Babesia divergens]